MANVYPRGLLFLIPLIIRSECIANSPITDTVSASQEEDIKFPCFNSTVTDPRSCYRVKLVKYSTDASQAKTLFAWPKKIQDANRVKWEFDENGEKSLYLTRVQKSDEGLYGCEACQGWDCSLLKNVSLKVKDCKTNPALKEVPGAAVKLQCPVDITSGPQNVTWAMLKGGKPVNMSFKRVEVNGTSLVITSVNPSDSGWYRCQYMFGQTQRCFDINLLVQEGDYVVKTTTVPDITTTAATTQQAHISNETEEEKEGSSGATVAVVVPVFTGIVIIAALTGLFLHRRRNTPRAVQRTRSHPAGAVRQSSTVYEVVSLAASEDPANHVNMLYQQFEDESMKTFHYK